MTCNALSQAPYHQYRPKQTMPVWPASIFDCDFVGVGITETDATGPVVDIAKAVRRVHLTPGYGLVPGLPDNPLAVDAEGVKAWDAIDFAPGVPSFEHPDASMRVAVGECPDHVCGIERKQTACAPVVPANIVAGGGSVRVTVSHEVQAGTGEIDRSWFGAIPVWRPRFDQVESTGTAGYTAASTFPPNPNAAATLQDSE